MTKNNKHKYIYYGFLTGTVVLLGIVLPILSIRIAEKRGRETLRNELFNAVRACNKQSGMVILSATETGLEIDCGVIELQIEREEPNATFI